MRVGEIFMKILANDKIYVGYEKELSFKDFLKERRSFDEEKSLWK